MLTKSSASSPAVIWSSLKESPARLSIVRMLPSGLLNRIVTALVLVAALVAIPTFASSAFAHGTHPVPAAEPPQSTAAVAIGHTGSPERYVAAESYDIVVAADSCPDGDTDHQGGCCASIAHCVSGCGAAITARETALPSISEELPRNYCCAPTTGIVTIPNEPPPRRLS